MCDLCTLHARSKKNVSSDKSLGIQKLGRIRRRLVHHNNVVGKGHTLPENILRAEWQYIDNKKAKSETLLRNNLEKVFQSEVELFIKKLKEKVGLKELKQGPDITPLIVNTLLKWNEWFARTEEAAKQGLNESAKQGFETALSRIDAQGPDFTSRERRVRNVVNELSRQAAGTQQTFRRVAIEEIQTGLSEGDDMSRLVQRVSSKTSEQVGHRLDRIVRTSAHGGFEVGQKEAFRKSGISRIRWLTQRDPRVRTPTEGDKWNHRSADGQEVGINETFLIVGSGGRTESLEFPGDPKGSPGNIIYCRCTISPVG